MLTSYRKANAADIDFVVTTYNEIIAEGLFTADTTPYNVDEKKEWFANLIVPPSGLFIVSYEEIEVGYFYFSPWRKGRAALAAVAEITYYLQNPYRALGIGPQMIEWCMQQAQEAGYKHLLAIMLDSNLRSMQLLQKHGFQVAGHLKNVAEFPNRIDGQYIMQYSF